MKQIIAQLIERYGSSVERVDGETATGYKAFLQLVTSKSWQNMERLIPTGGEVPRGQYLYIGPTDVTLHGGDLLRLRGCRYIVRRANTIYLGDEALFVWGLCVEGGDEA